MKSSRKTLLIVAKILFTLGGLYFASLKINLLELKEVLLHSNFIWLLLALVLLMLSKVASAFRTYFLLQAIHVTVNLLDNIRLCFVGLYYNTFLPGSIGGDAYKIFYLNQLKIQSLKKIGVGVFLDRLSGIWAIGLLLSVFVLLRDLTFKDSLIAALAGAMVLLAFPLKYAMLYLLFPSFKQAFWKISFFSIVVQVTQVLCCVAILTSIGVQESILLFIILFLVSSIVSIIPISFGGLGIREATFIMLDDVLKISFDVNNGVILSLLFFFINILSSLPGGFISMTVVTTDHKANQPVADLRQPSL